MSKGRDELVTFVQGLCCPGLTQLFLPKDPGGNLVPESQSVLWFKTKQGDNFDQVLILVLNIMQNHVIVYAVCAKNICEGLVYDSLILCNIILL